MKIIAFLLAALLPAALGAYQLGMPNLPIPVPLNRGGLEFDFQHRFFGNLLDKPLDSFFGWDNGSNTSFGFRYGIIPGLEANISRTSWAREYALGFAFARFLPKAHGGARLGLDGFAYNPDTSYAFALYPHLELQTAPIIRRIKPALTAGYDLLPKRIVLGAGLSVTLLRDFGYFQEICLVGEYYPYLGDRSGAGPGSRINDAFVAGFGFSTWGHQFLVTVSNGTALGVRRQGEGVTTYTGQKSALYVGFTIRRLLVRGRE